MPSNKPIQQLDIPLIGGPLDGHTAITYDPPMLDFEWWGNWESQKHFYMLEATARGYRYEYQGARASVCSGK